MSWSVSAQCEAAAVMTELDRQFTYPLAEPPAGLADEGERETVRRIRETIAQVMGTFDPARVVRVTAHGHMGFDDWNSKAGAYQNVNLSISV